MYIAFVYVGDRTTVECWSCSIIGCDRTVSHEWELYDLPDIPCSSRRDDVDGRFSNWNAGLECRQDDCERPRGSRDNSSIGGDGNRCDKGGEKAIAPRLLNEIVGCDESRVVL